MVTVATPSLKGRDSPPRKFLDSVNSNHRRRKSKIQQYDPASIRRACEKRRGFPAFAWSRLGFYVKVDAQVEAPAATFGARGDSLTCGGSIHSRRRDDIGGISRATLIEDHKLFPIISADRRRCHAVLKPNRHWALHTMCLKHFSQAKNTRVGIPRDQTS